MRWHRSYTGSKKKKKKNESRSATIEKQRNNTFQLKQDISMRPRNNQFGDKIGEATFTKQLTTFIGRFIGVGSTDQFVDHGHGGDQAATLLMGRVAHIGQLVGEPLRLISDQLGIEHL